LFLLGENVFMKLQNCSFTRKGHVISLPYLTPPGVLGTSTRARADSTASHGQKGCRVASYSRENKNV
jgi:hypothetical protein